jgi:AraC-like DNA-binding protein
VSLAERYREGQEAVRKAEQARDALVVEAVRDGSLRLVASELGVSHTMVAKIVRRAGS